jgi:hypothetical protein
VLLALVAGYNAASAMLNDRGIDAETVRTEIGKLIKSGSELVTKEKLPLTPRTKKAIKNAGQEAKSFNQDSVNSEHVLLGLLKVEDSVAAGVLYNLGISYDDVYQEIRSTDLSPQSSENKTAASSQKAEEKLQNFKATLPNGVTVAAKPIIDAIKKCFPENYFIKEIKENSWPTHLEKGSGIALYIADNNIQYTKQQHSARIWLMSKDYSGKSTIKGQGHGPAEPPAAFIGETKNFKIYNWPGPTDLAKKIIEVIQDAEKEISQNSELKTENFTATLPNGVTVELLGVCDHPSAGKQWWQPDGSILNNRPYEKLSGTHRDEN